MVSAWCSGVSAQGSVVRVRGSEGAQLVSRLPPTGGSGLSQRAQSANAARPMGAARAARRGEVGAGCGGVRAGCVGTGCGAGRLGVGCGCADKLRAKSNPRRPRAGAPIAPAALRWRCAGTGHFPQWGKTGKRFMRSRRCAWPCRRACRCRLALPHSSPAPRGKCRLGPCQRRPTAMGASGPRPLVARWVREVEGVRGGQGCVVVVGNARQAVVRTSHGADKSWCGQRSREAAPPPAWAGGPHRPCCIPPDQVQGLWHGALPPQAGEE